MSQLHFVDFAILLTSIVLPGLVSLYYGISKAQRGERFLGVFPINLSLFATSISGIAMVGTPNESYLYGLDMCFYVVLGSLLVTLINRFCVIPVMYRLDIESAYQYLEIRFDARVRKLASFIYIITKIVYTAMAAYPAGIVMNHFLGQSIDTATLGLILLCAISAAIGGFRGVVWTDAYQAIIMWICLAAYLVVVYIHSDGLTRIYEVSRNSGRLQVFDVDFDPTRRLTLWSGLTGVPIMCLSYSGVNPAFYQRYSALKTERDARKAAYISDFQIVLIIILLYLSGLAIYSTFYGCDPTSAGLIDNYLYTLTHFIDQSSETVVGLKGLFMSCVVCASLSTMSTDINTAATLIYTEFTKHWKCIPDRTGSVSVRIFTLLIGFLAVGFFFIIKGAGSIVEIFQRFTGGIMGQTVGIFILGMCFLSANSQGSFWGGLLSLCLTSFISLGSKFYGITLIDKVKTLSTDLCPFNVTTYTSNVTTSHENIPVIFRITPFYYPFIAALLTVILSLVFSRLTRKPSDRNKLKKELFIPCVQRLFRDSFYAEIPLNEISPTDK